MKCGHRKERGSEERTWHLRIPGRDCELARNDGVLPSLRIRGCAGGGERECISAEVLALVPGAFHRAARNWILAAARRAVVLAEAELFERGPALDSHRARRGDDRFPAANCRIHCRSSFSCREVKKKFLGIGIAAVTLLLGGVPANGFFHAARTRTSRHTHRRELLSVPGDLRQIHRRAPPGAPSFSDVSHLSARGLRNRTALAAPFGPFAPGTGSVGADASDGLASTVHGTLGRIPDLRARQFWDPQHFVAQELGRIVGENPGNRSPIVASARDSSGTMPFSMHHIRSGGKLRRLLSGTVRSSAWLLPSRRRFRM